ncbi:MAG TPA: nucleotidyltransferase [Thermaerobacter sp.]
MGNIRSISEEGPPRLAFVRLEGAWVTAAGLAGRVAAVIAGDVVVDLSAGARRAGLRPGMRARAARRLLPGLIVVGRDELDPLAALEPFYRLLYCWTPWIEPVVDGLGALAGFSPGQDAGGLARHLVSGGAARWGHRLVIGVGRGRLVARLAAHAAEAGWARWLEPENWRPLALPALPVLPMLPGGRQESPARAGDGRRRHRRLSEPPEGGEELAVVGGEVPEGREAAFLAPLPVTALRDVPPVMRQQLARLGLRRLGDIAEAPLEVIARAAGPLAPALRAWCRGDDRRPLVPGFPPPEVAVSASAPPELAEEALARWWVEQLPGLAQQLAAELQRRLLVGRVVVLAGETATVRRQLAAATADAGGLARTALGLYERLREREPCPARLRLAVTGLDAPSGQLDLTAWLPPAGRAAGSPGLGPGWPAGAGPAPRRAEALQALLADLGRRYPGRVRWGRDWPASRRERQLAFWDPWRRFAHH